LQTVSLPLQEGIRVFRLSHCRPSSGLPYGWLAVHRETRRSDDLSTFHVIIHNGQLRRDLDAGGTTIPLPAR